MKATSIRFPLADIGDWLQRVSTGRPNGFLIAYSGVRPTWTYVVREYQAHGGHSHHIASAFAQVTSVISGRAGHQFRGNEVKSCRLQCFRGFAAVVMTIGMMSWMPAQAQESRWAPTDESTAKSLIDYERQWAEAGCNHNGIQKTILAEDFYGTAPDGSRYSKKKELADAQSEVREEACTIYEVTVHLFGDAMAILYGSESAVHVEADGRKHTVKLTWTDTWLKRRGVWQIVAAQDMPSEVK